MLTLFVDDLLITGPSNASVAEVRSMLMAIFAMTDLGDVTQILGIEVKHQKELGTIELNQGKYTLSVLERFNMSDCNPVHTPGVRKELESQPDGSVPLDEHARKV